MFGLQHAVETIAPAGGASTGVAIAEVLVPSALILGQWLSNHLKGKHRERTGNTALVRIEKKLDDYQTETRTAYRELAERVGEVRDTAGEALSHAIGADGKNGHRSRIEDLERWRQDEAERERDRLELLENERERERERTRRLGPTDVGGLSPKGV